MKFPPLKPSVSLTYHQTLFLVLMLVLILPALATERINDNQRNSDHPLVNVFFETLEQKKQILSMLLPWEIHTDSLLANPSPEILENLQNLGFQTQILYRNRAELFPKKRANQAEDAGAFHTYDELKSALQQLQADYPNLASLHDLGDSWEKTQGIADRDIWALKISTNASTSNKDKRALFVGGHHAREWISVEVPLKLAEYLLQNYANDIKLQSFLSSGEIWIVPMVNPDGHQYSVDYDRWWRKNRRKNPDGGYGVDLNRNYAYQWSISGSSSDNSSNTYHGSSAFSEPETQAIRDLANGYHFNAMISYHSYGEQVFFPWNYTETSPLETVLLGKLALNMREQISAFNGKNYEIGQGAFVYPAGGTTDDWFYAQFGTASYTIELPPHGSPYFELKEEDIQPSFNENLPAALVLIEWSQLTNPEAKVELNNSSNLNTISENTELSIAIGMQAGNRSDIMADWWLYAESQLGQYFYDASTGTWQPGLQLSYQGKAFDISMTEVLKTSSLPLGNYIIYFGLETHADGLMDKEIIFLNHFPFSIISNTNEN